MLHRSSIILRIDYVNYNRHNHDISIDMHDGKRHKWIYLKGEYKMALRERIAR